MSGGATRWAVSVVTGANIPTASGRFLPAALVEASWTLREATTVFSRVEYLRRTAAELALTGSVPSDLAVGAAALGAARRVWSHPAWGIWLGGRGVVNFVPAALEPFYGSRTPVGALLYFQIRAGEHSGA